VELQETGIVMECKSKPLRAAALAVGLVLAVGAAGAAELVVLCAGAMRPAFEALSPAFTARTGTTLKPSYAPAGELRRKLAAGEAADIVILPVEHFEALETAGLTRRGSRRDLAAVAVGMAVPPGRPMPDISTEDGLKRALVDARSVSYMDPRAGTSGKHMDEVVLPRLGLRDEVRAKAQLGQSGVLVDRALRGEVDLVFQQMTELMGAKDVPVAELPASLQKLTVYSGAVLSSARSPEPAQSLLDQLARWEDVRAAMMVKGYKPVP
jgi:molybdate transport system substrate-binding protein